MNKDDNFEPWMIKWEEKHVKRFWDWQGQNPDKADLYFSNLLGDAILDEVERWITLSGVVVDWGSGPGFMVEKLLQRGLDTLAVDSSIGTVNLLKERFLGRPHFLGAEISTAEFMLTKIESADITLLIETVEHLDDKILSDVLSEIHRTLKPGGAVIVTTPNQENLKASHVMCPNCGCVFHNVQHVRSLTPDSLRETMLSAGFVELACKPTLFSRYTFVMRHLHLLKYKLKGESLPHLIYIGKKSSEKQS